MYRHGAKSEGCCAPFRGVSWVCIQHNVAWAKAYLRAKWHLYPSSRLATVDTGRKVSGLQCSFWGRLGPDLTQYCLGRGLPLYQVPPSSIQPFGSKRHGRKLGGGGCDPFLGELSPHLTQCALCRGLPPYQMAYWSIQLLGHNSRGPNSGAAVPFLGEGGWVPI